MAIFNEYWNGTNQDDIIIFDENSSGFVNAAGHGGDDLLVDRYYYYDSYWHRAYYSHDYFDGGAGDDNLQSGAGSDWLIGGDGNDYLYSDYDGERAYLYRDFLAPGSGNDYVDGGNQTWFYGESYTYNGDLVYYADAVTGYGVVVNLAGSDGVTGIAYDPWGGVDTLVNIEGVVGTGVGDYLFGNSENNDFIGFSGADVIYGAEGEDTLQHYLINPTSDSRDQIFEYTSGVIVDLGAGYARDPWWYYDTLISIENVRGTELDDVLIGSDGDNVIGGGLTLEQGSEGGNDLIWGMGGDDTIVAGVGSSTIYGGDGDDLIVAGGSDFLFGGAGTDHFLLDPRSDSEAGPDYIADFNDAEDFLIISTNYVEVGGAPFVVVDDTYTIFDYSGNGVVGAYIQFEGRGDDHFVFVENVTALELSDNLVSNNTIYDSYSPLYL